MDSLADSNTGVDSDKLDLFHGASQQDIIETSTL